MPRTTPSSSTSARFDAGDHLRVRRGLPYDHHGIFVSEDRVVQFGGSISDKPHASIGAVSLTEFARAGRPEVVDHTKQPHVLGMPVWHPEPLPRAEIVDRAEWLCAQQFPPGFYNVVGSNCEHVANWCVTGAAESFQARRTFLPVGLATAGVYHWGRRRGPLPPWAWPVLIGGIALGFLLPTLYNLAARRLYGELKRYPGMGRWEQLPTSEPS